jgi:hypothetical protein
MRDPEGKPLSRGSIQKGRSNVVVVGDRMINLPSVEYLPKPNAISRIQNLATAIKETITYSPALGPLRSRGKGFDYTPVWKREPL